GAHPAAGLPQRLEDALAGDGVREAHRHRGDQQDPDEGHLESGPHRVHFGGAHGTSRFLRAASSPSRVSGPVATAGRCSQPGSAYSSGPAPPGWGRRRFTTEAARVTAPGASACTTRIVFATTPMVTYGSPFLIARRMRRAARSAETEDTGKEAPMANQATSRSRLPLN